MILVRRPLLSGEPTLGSTHSCAAGRSFRNIRLRMKSSQTLPGVLRRAPAMQMEVLQEPRERWLLLPKKDRKGEVASACTVQYRLSGRMPGKPFLVASAKGGQQCQCDSIHHLQMRPPGKDRSTNSRVWSAA